MGAAIAAWVGAGAAVVAAIVAIVKARSAKDSADKALALDQRRTDALEVLADASRVPDVRLEVESTSSKNTCHLRNTGLKAVAINGIESDQDVPWRLTPEPPVTLEPNEAIDIWIPSRRAWVKTLTVTVRGVDEPLRVRMPPAL